MDERFQERVLKSVFRILTVFRNSIHYVERPLRVTIPQLGKCRVVSSPCSCDQYFVTCPLENVQPIDTTG